MPTLAAYRYANKVLEDTGATFNRFSKKYVLNDNSQEERISSILALPVLNLPYIDVLYKKYKERNKFDVFLDTFAKVLLENEPESHIFVSKLEEAFYNDFKPYTYQSIIYTEKFTMDLNEIKITNEYINIKRILKLSDDSLLDSLFSLYKVNTFSIIEIFYEFIDEYRVLHPYKTEDLCLDSAECVALLVNIYSSMCSKGINPVNYIDQLTKLSHVGVLKHYFYQSIIELYSKTKAVKKEKHSRSGFIELDLRKDKGVFESFYDVVEKYKEDKEYFIVKFDNYFYIKYSRLQKPDSIKGVEAELIKFFSVPRTIKEYISLDIHKVHTKKIKADKFLCGILLNCTRLFMCVTECSGDISKPETTIQLRYVGRNDKDVMMYAQLFETR
jgi:glutaredoxin-related protein